MGPSTSQYEEPVVIESKQPMHQLMLRPSKLRAVPGGPMRNAVRAGKKKNKGKGKKKPSHVKRRGPLADVSASTVSLQDAADFLGAAWRYGSYALGVINAEEKEYYFSPVNAVITGQGQYLLSGIAQGVTQSTRIGDSIKCTNMRIDYTLLANSVAGFNGTRIIILRDLMNTGSTPAFADVLQDTSSSALINVSPYLSTIADRFEVLYDVVHAQSYVSADAFVHKRIGLGISDHVLYQGTGATVASCWQGNIFLLINTDQNVNGPKLTMSSLMNFIDN
jgi:hypothetical protein